MIQSTNGRLTVTHTAPCDRFGEHTDTQSHAAEPLVPAVKHRKQQCAKQHKWTLFAPVAASSEGEAACQDKTPPGSWMECCFFY